LNKKYIRLITIISVFFSVLWISGLAMAVGKFYAGKPEPIPHHPKEIVEKKTNELSIVALGDSLTRGTGDETGKGYVGVLVDEIQEKSKQPVKLTNLGIIGQRSNQLKEQVQEAEVQRQLETANYVLVTIGGNDLFQGGQGLVDYETMEDIEDVEKKFTENIQFIFQQIQNVNKEATVFFIGLYNPFIDLDEGKEISQIVRHWNYQSAEVSASFPRVVFVPTFDLFELKVNDYLYTDKFHPNTEGYRLIAERVASLLTW
jgi:lysophospholipase L1-like esterase